VLQVRTLSAQVDGSLVQERMMAVLASSFGVLALLLAVIGVYGVLAYSVARRTGEIGVRIAVGAQQSQVMRLVLRQSLGMPSIGFAAGIAGAAAVLRLLTRMLYGLAPLDPQTLAGAVVVLALAVAAASYLPARRATRIDPLVALRGE